MEIIRDRDKHTIKLSQSRYIESILERFDMGSSHPVNTPMDPKCPRCTDVCDACDASGHRVRSRCSEQICSYPRTSALDRSKACLSVYAFVDADWASDVNDRCSITGYIFSIFSSTEAEYMAATAATKEAVWLRTLLRELNSSETPPITLQIDNQSAILLAENAMFHERTKHIAIRYHFIREKLEEGEICVEYVPTNEQIADVLTKALAREKHGRFIEGMGVLNGESLIR